MSGRFAPSPTGDLHLGNLRTALVAWVSARAGGLGFVVRMEDLDRNNSLPAVADRQLGDLAALGLDWDGPVMYQSERFDRYDEVIRRLVDCDAVYPCFCTRREIREAVEAPHGEQPDGAYPGTCRDLSTGERRRRSDERPAALRLRTDRRAVTVRDEIAGEYTATLDDFVIRRNDGVPAYHLAVVVDDADQGVSEVVRGDDLLTSTPRHVHLQRLLGLATPRYLHVPLVVGPSGERLAKRDGAVTVADLAERRVGITAVRSALAASIGLAEPGDDPDPAELVRRFGALDPRRMGGPPVPLEAIETLLSAR